jgi:phosphohistidine phosphatase
MKRLILLRHAKSQQDETVKDKERPLNARGRADAPRIGSYMHHERYLPQLVLCSTARRTVETWELIAPELDSPVPSRFADALYLASAASIAKLVRAVDDAVSVLLVVGHNPGLEECAQQLTRKPETEAEQKFEAGLRTKFPTCALAVLDFDIAGWRDVGTGSGALVDFARPKDMKDE